MNGCFPAISCSNAVRLMFAPIGLNLRLMTQEYIKDMRDRLLVLRRFL